MTLAPLRIGRSCFDSDSHELVSQLHHLDTIRIADATNDLLEKFYFRPVIVVRFQPSLAFRAAKRLKPGALFGQPPEEPQRGAQSGRYWAINICQEPAFCSRSLQSANAHDHTDVSSLFPACTEAQGLSQRVRERADLTGYLRTLQPCRPCRTATWHQSPLLPASLPFSTMNNNHPYSGYGAQPAGASFGATYIPAGNDDYYEQPPLISPLPQRYGPANAVSPSLAGRNSSNARSFSSQPTRLTISPAQSPPRSSRADPGKPRAPRARRRHLARLTHRQHGYEPAVLTGRRGPPPLFRYRGHGTLQQWRSAGRVCAAIARRAAAADFLAHAAARLAASQGR